MTLCCKAPSLLSSSKGTSSDLPVTGDIPKALDGTLYRNGPNPQFAPRGHYHWFGGDGMVHAFTLENGRATYRNRWVRTPRFELERTAGEALFGGFGDPSKSDPSVIGKDFGVANTHIIYHAGKLLALEESHLFPFELTRSLDFVGYHTFGGVLPRPSKAALRPIPKSIPRMASLSASPIPGAALFGTRMSLVIVAASGELVRQDFFERPTLVRPRLPHDQRSRTRTFMSADVLTCPCAVRLKKARHILDLSACGKTEHARKHGQHAVCQDRPVIDHAV